MPITGYGRRRRSRAERARAARSMPSAGIDTAIMDTLTALVLHNLFGRFPRLKVATIEMGAAGCPI